jgi:molybdenum cofactor cytidylyltransferase
MSESQVGIIILAAGGSTKLGHPKQLVQFEGQSLIRRSVEMALAVDAAAVIVILGSKASEIADEIGDLPAKKVINDDWSAGISSSLKAGLARLIELHPSIEAALIMLSDQPFISEQTVRSLLDAYHSSDKPIAAAEYNGVVGVPAVFDRSVFDELMTLEGDAGARVVIRRDPGRVAAVPMPEAAFDIDTPDDLDRLKETGSEATQRKRTAI